MRRKHENGLIKVKMFCGTQHVWWNKTYFVQHKTFKETGFFFSLSVNQFSCPRVHDQKQQCLKQRNDRIFLLLFSNRRKKTKTTKRRRIRTSLHFITSTFMDEITNALECSHVFMPALYVLFILLPSPISETLGHQ